MKSTFNTLDLHRIVTELKVSIVGLRVNQIYDVDHKTYLIKLQQPNVKVVLLLESASRIHTTEYDWPKSPAPSGFAMKLRKHLRNKRIESIEQLGVDRIIDLKFGSGEAAYHVIVEVYDRGNIVLTDHNYEIVNVLRPRKDGEDTKIIVHEKYPVDLVRTIRPPLTSDALKEAFEKAKPNTPFKKILNPLLDCGSAVLEHELIQCGFVEGKKFTNVVDLSEEHIQILLTAAANAQQSIIQSPNDEQKETSKGFIIQKEVQKAKPEGGSEIIYLFEEFHPMLFKQHTNKPHISYDTFNKACDEYFSKLEANEVDKKTLQKEKEALKKLENVKKDHERRIKELHLMQQDKIKKGQLIELNKPLVEAAMLVVRSAIANQIDWAQIQQLLNEAQARNDPIALAIKGLKLKTNCITMMLSDPYDYDEDDLLLDSDEEREETSQSSTMRPMAVDIDLDLSALANARTYYNEKRQAAQKEQKTVSASMKAIKSAEKKTQLLLKETSSIANIIKTRKVFWFEKFLWFISSENFLVIAGRDNQQNEQVVKRHLKSRDVYVHADLHGAASVVVKNPSSTPVPPSTLHEAGIMALCYSRAWDEKVVTSAWWVWGEQVSKTAPAGEYLTTGAFMVRGKKNFLPPSHLVYGFGFLFRLEEGSIQRHIGERKIRNVNKSEKIVENDDKILELIEEEGDDDKEKVNEDIEEFTEDKKEMTHSLQKLEIENETNSMPSESIIDEDDETEDNDNEEETEDNDNEEETEDNDNEEETEVKDAACEFPDTVVQLQHLTGDKFVMTASPANENSAKIGDKRRKQKHSSSSNRASISKTDNGPSPAPPSTTLNPKQPQVHLKRGQKGKLKKMKKYKDQDEEDKQLRMQLLQSAGPKKESKKNKRKKAALVAKTPQTKVIHLIKPTQDHKENKPGQEINKDMTYVDDEEEEGTQVADDLQMLSALTAFPVTEDELLYAVPVCAPYVTMTDYKFRVKLTPGPGKKGKACKTALSLFLTQRGTCAREKDLLKAVKDHDLAKNLPGKVKISAPNISKVKK